MSTTATELVLLNKNREKRSNSSAHFAMQVEMPGSKTLDNGPHVIGKLEGNVCITRVVLLVREGFVGTLPTLTLQDNLGNVYFTNEDIATVAVTESGLTANAIAYPDPVYSPGVVEFTAALVGDSTSGLLGIIVDYVQLDTVCGKYTR